MKKASIRINVLANSQESVAVVPPVIKVVEIQVPLVGITPQIRNAPVIPILPDRAVLYDISPAPPPLDCSQDCI